MRYLDPKNDLTFKKIFGNNPDVLMSFLNALMPFESDRYITELTYLTPEMAPESPLAKNSIVDVRCVDNYKRQFIVEMQMFWTDSFKGRVLFNASKAFVRQLPTGAKYESLQPVYTLSLVNDIFRPKSDNYYHHYGIVDVLETNERLEGMEFIFVELPKFKPQSLTEKKMTVLWLRFMTEIQDGMENVSEDFTTEDETRKALQLLQESSFSKDELMMYDRYWDSISTERTLIDERERKAKEAGLAEGETKGLSKGKQQKAIEIARKLKQKGMAIADIVELTGLDKYEIVKIGE